ncbi:unnamed protein product [Trichobilharzia szidati]|nr:unnamed protein product [Trichobilharzia szidati]
MLENAQNKHFVFRGNSSTTIMPRLALFNERLRSASLPPAFSSQPIGIGNYHLTAKRSIIANTGGNASPLLVNSACYSPYACPTYACQHDGADWEDCRISIDCFGIKASKCNYARRLQGENCTNYQYDGNTTTTVWDGLQSTKYYLRLPVKLPTIRIEEKKLPQAAAHQSIKSHSLSARSVRLSIIPLNPIYKKRRSTQATVKRRLCRNNNQQSTRGKPTTETERTNWISAVDLNTCRTTLRNCWRKSLIQRMAFKIDDFTIQEDQVKVAKDVFKRFDKRGQEKISTTDLGPAFRALNLTVKPDTLKEWADQVDDDATGFIDFNGFLICYGKKLQEDQDERDLRDAFRVLDKNKRGEIDVEDLRWILKGLGDDLTEEEIDDMIRDTDTDGSGFVDFDATRLNAVSYADGT